MAFVLLAFCSGYRGRQAFALSSNSHAVIGVSHCSWRITIDPSSSDRFRTNEHAHKSFEDFDVCGSRHFGGELTGV